MNPYSGTKPHQHWSSAVADRYLTDIDWTPLKRFTIEKEDKIVSLGSCFAQHISQNLISQGYNYFFADECSPNLGHRLFSARYGNIYSIRQARQLVERAFNIANYPLSSESWLSRSGQIIDPFRPNEFPEGFPSEQEMLVEREKHLSYVREVFATADIIIFTLGLTESWVDVQSNAVLPVAPGIYGGPWPSYNYKFINFGYQDCQDDLRKFMSYLQQINPSVRLILTVSPVNLVATMDNQSVAISTSYSKSVLRAVAGAESSLNNNVYYFPSYEIITAPSSMGLFFDSDFRTVTKAGVKVVMKVFWNQFSSLTATTAHGDHNSRWLPENSAANQVECDEDIINSLL